MTGARATACSLPTLPSGASRGAERPVKPHRDAKQGKKAAKRAAAAAAAAEAGLGDGAPGRVKPDPSRKDDDEEGEAYELGPRRQLREAAEGRRAASLPVKVDGELVYGRGDRAAAAPQVSYTLIPTPDSLIRTSVVVFGNVLLQVWIQAGVQADGQLRRR